MKRKRIAALLLAALVLLCLGACAKEPSHDEMMSEIRQRNQAYQVKRRAFLDSPEHAAGVEYVTATLAELLPEVAPELSLEPGALLGEDLSPYAELAADEAQRLEFFNAAELSVTLDRMEYDDAEALMKELMARGLSGTFSTDGYGADYWIVRAKTGELSYYRRPGV